MRLVAFLLAVSAGPVWGQVPCGFTAFALSETADPSIHAGPSPETPVLGHAPSQQDAPGDTIWGASMWVVEMRDGWAQVKEVSPHDGSVLELEGWIRATDLYVSIQTEVVYAAPDPASDVVYAGWEWPRAEALLDCRGDWVKVRFMSFVETTPDDWVEAGMKVGWLRGVCGNQETTCDGLMGDSRPPREVPPPAATGD